MGRHIEIKVFNNDVERAIRVLKKKIQNDGLFKTLKEKRYFEKPSDKKKRKHQEALKRLKRKTKK